MRRIIVYAAGALALFAATPASAQRNYSYSEWSNGFGPPASYGGGRYRSYASSAQEEYEMAQGLEAICAIGTIASFFAPAAGAFCIPSQLMGLGQMFQPQPRRQYYAEARPRRRIVRHHRPRPHRVRYASRKPSESEDQRFERLLNAHLERNNLMLVPRVTRERVTPAPAPTPPARTSAPAPEPEPRIESPKRFILVNAGPQKAVFTRSAILRGDLVDAPTRLASEGSVPVPRAPERPTRTREIDVKLIRSAIAAMR